VGRRQIVIAMLADLSSRSQEAALVTALVVGMAASVSLCAAVRLPIVLAYILGVADSRRHGMALTGLFALGLIAGTVLLGTTVAPAEDGLGRVMYVSKHLFWVLGVALFLIGVLLSGMINPHLLSGKSQALARRLVNAGLPGAFLLGGGLALLQMPICSRCGSALMTLADGAGGNGFILFTVFAAGQSLTVLVIGGLTSLIRPDLILRLRPWMCSIEQHVQLLAGNILMVLGLYFVIVG
jgi:hypothetical protein